MTIKTISTTSKTTKNTKKLTKIYIPQVFVYICIISVNKYISCQFIKLKTKLKLSIPVYKLATDIFINGNSTNVKNSWRIYLGKLFSHTSYYDCILMLKLLLIM